MFRSLITFFFLTIGLVALGCGETTVTPDDACTAMASAACAKLVKCWGISFDSQYADFPTCEAREKLRCQSNFTAEGSRAAAADVKACADAFPEMGCDYALTGNWAEVCRPTPGTLANGRPCGRDTQCASTKCVTKGELCGVCAEPIAAGGACTMDEECVMGLTCINQVCTAFATKGEACDPTPCVPSLACVDNVCEKPVILGNTCNGMGAADNCAKLYGYVCNASNLCKQTFVTTAGYPCGWVGPDFVVCQAKGHCRMDPATMSSVCIAAAADGEACDAAQGPDCMPGSLCVNGVCTLNDASMCN